MQVYKANAGLVPTIDWNVNTGGNLNQVSLAFIDGNSINRLGRSINPNTNLALNWTIYNGGRMQTRYNILKHQSELASFQIKAMEDVIVNNVGLAYANLTRQKATIAYLKNSIKYYEERLNITKQRWEIGRGSKLDYLQSQNDFNAQLSLLQNAELTLENQKVLFNLLLNRDSKTLFDVLDLAQNTTVYTEADVLNKSEINNEELYSINKNIDIAKLSVKELEGNLLPEINLNSTLGFSYSKTNAGQVLSNRNYGLGSLITARWNLFDGQHNKKQIAIAKLQTSVLEKRKEQIATRIKSEVFVALNTYNNAKKLLSLEENNKNISEESLNISLEKFRLGSSTILELNDAQQRFDNATNRYINAYFDVKDAELELERLMR
jgi:outer membrane protein